MTTLTLPDLDEATAERLRARAAENQRSLEEEAVALLRAALARPPEQGLGTKIRELVQPFGGVDLELPPRGPMREPPTFD